jgi:hypothetical protein
MSNLLELTYPKLEEMLIATNGEISGCDSNDNEYTSIEQLWNEELKVVNKPSETGDSTQLKWYKNAFDYWESEINCSISDDGVRK